MQTYRHANTVRADKIALLEILPTGGATLILEDASSHTVDKRWVENHSPKVGAYLIGEEPGRQVCWPADKFEATYLPL